MDQVADPAAVAAVAGEAGASGAHAFDLEALRRHRAELKDSISALEQALAAPAAGATWATRVHVALVELSSDFAVHEQLTEGPDGLHEDVLATAPRLANAVHRLTEDHREIRATMEEALAVADGFGTAEDVERVRTLGTALLGRLVRHRQRGSDLVYEAFETDVGGQD